MKTLFINGLPVSYEIIGIRMGWHCITVDNSSEHMIPSLHGRFRVNGNVYDFKEL